MDDSYERAATIGFRCAADADTSPPCVPTDDAPLCARADFVPGYVDVTALGTSDWVHFGDDPSCPSCPVRKAKPDSKARFLFSLYIHTCIKYVLCAGQGG